jgi:hypothetical protein
MNFVISIVAAYLFNEQVNQMARASSTMMEDFKDWVDDIKDSVKSRIHRPPPKQPKSEVRLKWEAILAAEKAKQ